jgi:PKD repeat protein
MKLITFESVKNIQMRSLLFLMFFLLGSGLTMGQCPLASFALPDSICAGTVLSPVNNSTGTNPLIYNWDFNAGDLNNAPSGAVIDTFANELINCLGMDIAIQNDSIYSFGMKSNGEITRFDFGTDITNVPAVINLGNPGLNGGNDLVIENINGNWYGFTETFGGILYRLDFGSDIKNTPVVQTINTGTSLNSPYYISFVYDSANYCLLVANIGNGSVAVVNFGSDITNINPVINTITVPGSSPISIAAGNDCGNWFAFVGYVGTADISRLDFGSSLTNPTPVITPALNVTGSITVRKIQMMRDFGKWYLAVISVAGDEMKLFDFGNSLGSTPTLRPLGGFNAISYGNYTFSIRKHHSKTIGISPNFVDGKLSWFEFPDAPSTGTLTYADEEPVLTFSDSGFYNVELTVTDSLTQISSVAVDSIFILPAALPVIQSSIPCQGQVVEFIDATLLNGLSVQNNSWDFGDSNSGSGDTVQHIYTAVGNFTVTLELQFGNGCITTADTLISVHESPQAAFTFTDYPCAGTSVSFADNSVSNDGAITGWNWNSGNGQTAQTPSFQNLYTTGGSYLVTEIIETEFGCTDTVSDSIHVRYAPAGNYEVSNTCIGETASFTNLTTIDSLMNLNYQWEFGDGNISSDIHPVNNYPVVADTYTVTLITIADNGCNDTIIGIITIGNKAIPYFKTDLTQYCNGEAISFTDSSYTINSNDTIIGWYWDFGDNTYDSVANPVHIFQTPGLYTVILRVTTATSCDTSYSAQINVLGSPVAGFQTSNICLGTAMNFTDSSTSAFGPLSTWTWSFGDSDSAFVQHPVHTYLTSGNFNVALLVTNQAGCWDTVTQTVTVHDIPVVSFGYSLNCTAIPVMFTDSSQVNSGTISAWYWDFGDGTTSTQQTPSHTYTVPQLYTVQLIATSSFGCVDSTSELIVINAAPDYTGIVSSVCAGNPNQFNAQAGPNQNSQYSYYWDFGDNTFSFLQNPQHTYNVPGNYNASLTVTDLNTFCNITSNLNAVVYQLPQPVFSADSICAGDTFQFVNNSTSVDGSIISNYWDFGQYGNSTLVNPQLYFADSGSVAVQLIVESSFGCRDSIEQTVRSHPNPSSDFTLTPSFGTPPLTVATNNTSSAGNYLWDFGDGSPVSTQTNPTHIYSDTGSFIVTLVTTTDKGCVDSHSALMSVLYPNLDLGIENLSFTNTNGTWKITCRLANSGNIPIESFRIEAMLEGKSPISESWSGTSLAPSDFLNFSFASGFVAGPGENPGYLCLSIKEVNGRADDNRLNDEKCASNTGNFEVLALYPVPATDFLQLGIAIPEEGLVSMEIRDAAGRLVLSRDATVYPQGYNQTTIDLRNIVSGVYFIQFDYNNKTIIQRFIRT